MGPKSFSLEYVSTGANRQTAVADWSRRGLVAFGADSNVALWRPTAKPHRGITGLLSGHKELVKSLTFLPEADSDESTYLVSGSDDKSFIVWKSSANAEDFRMVQTSAKHTGPINCITTLRLSESSPQWMFATGSTNATVKIWSFANDELRLLQSIRMTPKLFPLSLALSHIGLENEGLILAVAGTSHTIRVFTADSSLDTAQFDLQATLSGHESWIRSLSFTKESAEATSDLLLASASQDKYVRIWRVHEGKELPALAAAGADPSSDAYLPGKSPSNKAHKLKTAGQDFSITFEALLLGHEDWIYSARWHTQADGKLQLLTTSADNSLAIWEADPSSGIWISMVRLGEISREKGATTATGSTGGFWTGLWSPDGTSLACLGRTGSWRRWEYDAAEDLWKSCIAVSGHTKAVGGVAWSKDGAYLLSTSLDQTTRLHTKWTQEGEGTWHEMSRPQIHGYDLNCIDSLSGSQFVSGADEKLMRVFSMPRAVASMLSRLSGINEGNLESMPDAANMPILGLSNKAIDTAAADDEEIRPVDDRDRDAVDPASVVKKSHLDISHPPLEETLSRHTLWPETEKLYGHGYEISSLAASHDGRIVASACKASSANHAVIRLFETDRWTELRPPLTAHSLTATRLRFSADDKYLLSVGRDRQWAVFERIAAEAGADGESSPPHYQLLQSNPKGHSRMILDAAWAPSETPLFATAGRDKQVRIWTSSKDEQGKLGFVQSATIPGDAPVTAIDFLPRLAHGKLILAVATEAGRLSLHVVSQEPVAATELPRTPELDMPKAVLQLAWRPETNGGESTSHELAIAGEDSSLRLYSFSNKYLQGD